MSSDPPGKPTELDPRFAATAVGTRRHDVPTVAGPMPGTRLGRYTLARLLGQGGMASVYLAREDGSERPVALKLMSAELSKDPLFVTRFLHEVRATATLRHQNVVSVFDAGEVGGQYYMATEFVDGGTVASLLLRMRELPATLAAELVVQLLSGLAHAHQQGIVHRDLKPENLLLTSAGVLKVADFGVARTVDGGAHLTKTGMLIGTAGYMSPEQARGAKIDPRSDLFTVGIILYELLSGVNPYASDNPATSITRIISNAALPIATVRPSAPAALERVLDQLLQPDPAMRFGSAQDALAALLPFVETSRRTQPGLVAGCLRQPAEAKRALDAQTAVALVEEARPLLAGDATAKARAALKLYYALQHDPQHAEAEELLRGLAQQQPVYFGPTRNPKLAELEQYLEGQPEAAPALLQAAQLARLDGNPVKASVFLKRYLRVRPQDGYAAGQLTQLTGDVVRPVTAVKAGSSTSELVAGIKTGGLKANPARSGTAVAYVPGAAAPAPSPVASGLVEIAPVETQSPLPGLLLKVVVAAGAIAILAFGFRRLSRGMDAEADAMFKQDQASWKAMERRTPLGLDAGPSEPPVP